MRRAVVASVLLFVAMLCSARPSDAETRDFDVVLEAGSSARNNTPVSVEIIVPTAFANAAAGLRDAEGHIIAAQLTPPGESDRSRSPLPGGASLKRELHFILPKLDAHATLKLKGVILTDEEQTKSVAKFRWKDEPMDRIQLTFGGRRVMDYMDAPYDNSSKSNRENTYKVYDHLYDPVDGSRLITKGPGGLYTHHRGLFYGFQRVSYGPGGSIKVNIWECPNAHESHEAVLSSEAGPVFARHLLAIDWHGPEKSTGAIGPIFAREKREMTVYNIPGGTMIDFVSLLRTGEVGPVRLDGDPQHAGFQFRAAQEVAAKTKSQTIYIRPDGVGKPGETRNWSADPKKRDLNCVDLQWKGMSFVLGDQRYTAALLDQPDNPKEARYSERDYGRFGSYFEYNLTDFQPLFIHYRFWLQRGEMQPKEISALANDFVEPVKAMVEMH